MTTSTQTLTDFLLARITEDEARARAAPVSSGRIWFAPVEWSAAPAPSRKQTLHIVAWDPARVLAECDAKRRIVENIARVADEVFEYDLAGVLRLLALPYADHPDYREDWKP